MPVSSSARGLLLWVGLALMCAAVALTAFLFFLFLFSVPLFLVGLVLVLVSRQPAWLQGLAISFPFVAWVGIAAGAWALAPREQAITFLIPEGFEGTILVVKNEQCAPPTPQQDGRLLYHVPASGLLITRDTVPNRAHPFYDWPSRGYFQRPDNKYYVVDRQGRRLRELTEVHATTEANGNPEPTSTLLGVGRDELAAFYDSPMEQTPYSAGEVGYVFQCVTITTQNRYYTIENPSSLRLRALADSLLPRCRVRSGQPRQGRWKPRRTSFDVPAASATQPTGPAR